MQVLIVSKTTYYLFLIVIIFAHEYNGGQFSVLKLFLQIFRKYWKDRGRNKEKDRLNNNNLLSSTNLSARLRLKKIFTFIPSNKIWGWMWATITRQFCNKISVLRCWFQTGKSIMYYNTKLLLPYSNLEDYLPAIYKFIFNLAFAF
jgi:hypothetical protein